jgi:hypothetical protein
MITITQQSPAPFRVATLAELISVSPALHKADDRLYWATDFYRLYLDLARAMPHCRAYREYLAEASAELDSAEAAFEKALRRAESRWNAKEWSGR